MNCPSCGMVWRGFPVTIHNSGDPQYAERCSFCDAVLYADEIAALKGSHEPDVEKLRRVNAAHRRNIREMQAKIRDLRLSNYELDRKNRMLENELEQSLAEQSYRAIREPVERRVARMRDAMGERIVWPLSWMECTPQANQADVSTRDGSYTVGHTGVSVGKES